MALGLLQNSYNLFSTRVSLPSLGSRTPTSITPETMEKKRIASRIALRIFQLVAQIKQDTCLRSPGIVQASPGAKPRQDDIAYKVSDTASGYFPTELTPR